MMCANLHGKSVRPRARRAVLGAAGKPALSPSNFEFFKEFATAHFLDPFQYVDWHAVKARLRQKKIRMVRKAPKSNG